MSFEQIPEQYNFITELIIFQLLPLLSIDNPDSLQTLSDEEIFTMIKIRLATTNSKLKYAPEENVDPTVSNLAKLMYMTKSKMSRLIDNLVKNGLVDREPNEEDRRKLKLDLTNKGKEYLEKFYNSKTDFVNRISALYDAKELTAFTEYLERLNNFMNDYIMDHD